ncbi:MAG: hypothetical protein ACXVB1_18370, partial [Pseudobdellovibrionaceae bacterium]
YGLLFFAYVVGSFFYMTRRRWFPLFGCFLGFFFLYLISFMNNSSKNEATKWVDQFAKELQAQCHRDHFCASPTSAEWEVEYFKDIAIYRHNTKTTPPQRIQIIFADPIGDLRGGKFRSFTVSRKLEDFDHNVSGGVEKDLLTTDDNG